MRSTVDNTLMISDVSKCHTQSGSPRPPLKNVPMEPLNVSGCQGPYGQMHIERARLKEVAPNQGSFGYKHRNLLEEAQGKTNII